MNLSLYFHKDNLGSIVGITDNSGTTVTTYDYDSYGNTTLNGIDIGNERLYTGREYDSETELYYNRARYYNPKLGRFISQDPIGQVDDVNLYAYVGNNPINFTDLEGLNGKPVVQSIIDTGNYILDGIDIAQSLGDLSNGVANVLDTVGKGLETLGKGATPVLVGGGCIGGGVAGGLVTVPAGGVGGVVLGCGAGGAVGGMIGQGTALMGMDMLSTARYFRTEGNGGGGNQTPNENPNDFERLKKGQGYKDSDGYIWKKDQLHKDHWDITDPKTGKKVKEVDYNGKELWPNGPKNKNKKP